MDDLFTPRPDERYHCATCGRARPSSRSCGRSTPKTARRCTSAPAVSKPRKIRALNRRRNCGATMFTRPPPGSASRAERRRRAGSTWHTRPATSATGTTCCGATGMREAGHCALAGVTWRALDLRDHPAGDAHGGCHPVHARCEYAERDVDAIRRYRAAVRRVFMAGPGPTGHLRADTGQEDDDKRREILKNPPDILLTNYVMCRARAAAMLTW
jgi:hypothetical protein